MYKTIKVSKGEYRVINTMTDKYVLVRKNMRQDGSSFWVAIASWDSMLVTDPLFLKRTAVHHAMRMLITKLNKGGVL